MGCSIECLSHLRRFDWNNYRQTIVKSISQIWSLLYLLSFFLLAFPVVFPKSDYFVSRPQMGATVWVTVQLRVNKIISKLNYNEQNNTKVTEIKIRLSLKLISPSITNHYLSRQTFNVAFKLIPVSIDSSNHWKWKKVLLIKNERPSYPLIEYIVCYFCWVSRE